MIHLEFSNGENSKVTKPSLWNYDRTEQLLFSTPLEFSCPLSSINTSQQVLAWVYRLGRHATSNERILLDFLQTLDNACLEVFGRDLDATFNSPCDDRFIHSVDIDKAEVVKRRILAEDNAEDKEFLKALDNVIAKVDNDKTSKADIAAELRELRVMLAPLTVFTRRQRKARRRSESNINRDLHV